MEFFKILKLTCWNYLGFLINIAIINENDQIKLFIKKPKNLTKNRVKININNWRIV